MTAENMGADGHGEADPLMAAILDEPMPRLAYPDADRMSEYRAARADLATLRQELTVIANVLAAQEPAQSPGGSAAGHPQQPRPPWRGGRAIVVGGLVAALVVCAAFLLAWLLPLAQTETRSVGGATDAKVSTGLYVACARLIVEGTVTQVAPEPGTRQDRIELAVNRHYKPPRGPDRITFPMDHDVSPRLRPGDHVLISIPRQANSPDLWSTGEKQIAHDRAWILAALRESRTLTCDPNSSHD
ncbi:hypothetical protein HZZ00_24135 [Streptomyces sp. NEAU-sy36]|uniref:hypothetical protein n=1 Tax=unclassified Streptomyces TaxID=2593676 RepID=UPI0015D5B3CB|nr:MULTISPECIES: hypothetical protein [unclassified Streptomyces]QLJ03773.1 hypothetical protein HZZ00_24135 [Streptomyces sp. NEAU-sy36]